MKNKGFPQGFTEDKTEIIQNILIKLSKHLDLEKTWFVGGLVIKHHLFNEGVKLQSDSANDVDLMVSSLDAVRPSVTDDFMVWHYHPNLKNFYVVLLDPKTGIKIDIFDHNRPVMQEETVMVGDVTFKIRGVEDQFVEVVRDAYRIVNVEGFRNKQHYFDDMKSLKDVANLDKAQALWDKKDHIGFPHSHAWFDKKTGPFPKNILEAYEKALACAKEHPERVFFGEYSKKEPNVCEYCKSANGIIITPMEKVLEIYKKSQPTP